MMRSWQSATLGALASRALTTAALRRRQERRGHGSASTGDASKRTRPAVHSTFTSEASGSTQATAPTSAADATRSFGNATTEDESRRARSAEQTVELLEGIARTLREEGAESASPEARICLSLLVVTVETTIDGLSR